MLRSPGPAPMGNRWHKWLARMPAVGPSQSESSIDDATACYSSDQNLVRADTVDDAIPIQTQAVVVVSAPQFHAVGRVRVVGEAIEWPRLLPVVVWVEVLSARLWPVAESRSVEPWGGLLRFEVA